MVWILILSLTLAAGARVVQRWMVQQHAYQAEYDSDPEGNPAPLDAYEKWWEVWQLFSLERKILLAGAGTFLSEVIAVAIIRRLRDPSPIQFGRTSTRSPIRRYWYGSARSRRPVFITVPLIVAAGYLVTFIVMHMVIVTTFKSWYLQTFFTDPDSAGLSLSLLLRLVKAALFTYLLVNVGCGLILETASPRHERFLLIFAALVVAESRNTTF